MEATPSICKKDLMRHPPPSLWQVNKAKTIQSCLEVSEGKGETIGTLSFPKSTHFSAAGTALAQKQLQNCRSPLPSPQVIGGKGLWGWGRDG